MHLNESAELLATERCSPQGSTISVRRLGLLSDFWQSAERAVLLLPRVLTTALGSEKKCNFHTPPGRPPRMTRNSQSMTLS